MNANQDLDVSGIDLDALEDLGQGMDEGFLKLPYPHMFLRWQNGDGRAKAAAQREPVQYFGGWVADIEGAEIAEGEIAPLPSVFLPHTLPNKEGGTYEVQGTRALAVAIYGKRKRWTITDSGKKRSHVQYVGYMAEFVRKEDTFVPWGAVILSSKGTVAGHLEEEVARFSARTARVRREFLNKYFPNASSTLQRNSHALFYMVLGAVSEKPNVVQAGKGNDTSPTTPPQLYIPDEIDLDYLTRRFVGATIAAIMRDQKLEARDWLEEWAGEDGRNGNGGGGGNGNYQPQRQEDIPF